MRRVFTIIAVLLVCLTQTVPVLAAPAPPDDIDIINFYYNRHLYEADDFLLVVHYDIIYSGEYPDEPADDCFVFRLFDTDGTTELGQALPYPYANNGYGEGCVAFYFSAADAPTWNDSYVYKLRVSGNPLQFASPPVYNFDIPTSAWSDETTQAGNQSQLANRIIEIAESLEIEWETTLLSAQDAAIVLSSYGEEYLRNAIYGLQLLCPSLFYLQSTSLDVTDREWDTSLSETYKTRLDGTWVMDSLEDGASLLHLPLPLLVGVALLAACVFLIWKSHQWWNTAMPGYVASGVLVIGFSSVILGFTLLAIILFGCIFLVATVLFFNRA